MRYRPVASFFVLAAAASCGGDSPTDPTAPSSQVASVEVVPDVAPLNALGDTIRFTALARDAAGRTLDGTSFTWTTANAQVASVNSVTGLATAGGNGTTSILAEASGVQGIAVLTVAQVVASVSLSPSGGTLAAIGDTLRLTSTVLDSNEHPAPDQGLIWESSEPTVATVSSSGLVTSVGNGSTTISARLGDATGDAVISVNQSIVSISVTPTGETFSSIGDTSRLAAVALDGQGALIDDVMLTWNSSSASVATVSETGLVTAVSDGTALVTASAAGVEGSADVSVTQLAASFDLSPSSTFLIPGDTVRLVVSNAVDANGNPVLNAQFEYTASDPTVLSVDASGLVTVAPDAQPGTVGSIEVSTDAAVGSSGVTVLLRPASIGAGYFHTCSVTEAGEASCWGQGSHGQLGNGTNEVLSVLPVLVSGGHSFSALTVGGYHNCGVATDGFVYCWGLNTQGELGDGSTNQRNVPVPVIGGDLFSLIEPGNDATCGITRSGDSYCWGAFLGTEPGFSTTPLLTPGGHQFFTVDLGADHACAIEPGGAGYCWGSDTRGELGNGPAPASSVPGPVSGGHSFVSIETGSYHSCGVTTSGDALCWGRNQYGELGDGTTVDRDQPVLVSGGLSFKSVTTKARHTCGLTASGEAYCWGQNEDGRLGDGTATERWTPVAVSGGLLFEELDVGLYHSCGRSLAGDLYCWGSNAHGQLGDGTTTNRLIPTLVQQ